MNLSLFFVNYGFDPRFCTNLVLTRPDEDQYRRMVAQVLRDIHDIISNEILRVHDWQLEEGDHSQLAPPNFHTGRTVYLDARNIQT